LQVFFHCGHRNHAKIRQKSAHCVLARNAVGVRPGCIVAFRRDRNRVPRRSVERWLCIVQQPGDG